MKIVQKITAILCMGSLCLGMAVATPKHNAVKSHSPLLKLQKPKPKKATDR